MIAGRMAPAGVFLLVLVLALPVDADDTKADAPQGATTPTPGESKEDYEFRMMRLKMMNDDLGPRFDSAAHPTPPRRGGYKVGQRVVYTVWVDNDDPSDGMRDVVIGMFPLPPHLKLDLSPDQPAYGSIFTDSRLPFYPDLPGRCVVYYISQSGETLPLVRGTPPETVRHVIWVVTRGNGEQVVGPHNGNDNVYACDKPDTGYGAAVDGDQMYMRYAAIVVGKPAARRTKK
ncbi:MAG: hypothetical protein A3G34_04800 [Candidatus Lindowbacteria bacterium RIFCSPLOWO2_12_FULL_62_27]|nr:MAG: hypothetical protein A3I06_13120 [Candidatus Lindowbacteria bacterium RIFCSPLOWO2_02_FULL_62_12]OGH61317.1 MAG: hypothetical protein A3G34_04800 [Candidatus Lindowbacteria bacterium RIFCSPLOWO2_12_FULL_62_27]